MKSPDHDCLSQMCSRLGIYAMLSFNASGNACLWCVQTWIDEMAAFVKSRDANHLLTVGEDGFWSLSLDDSNNRTGCNPGNWITNPVLLPLICASCKSLAGQGMWRRGDLLDHFEQAGYPLCSITITRSWQGQCDRWHHH